MDFLKKGEVFKFSDPEYVGKFVTLDPMRSSKIERGMVWCKNCGRKQRVDSDEALSKGWPVCCEEIMTLDSPEERNE